MPQQDLNEEENKISTIADDCFTKTGDHRLSIPFKKIDLEAKRQCFQNGLKEIREQEVVLKNDEKENDELFEFIKTLQTLGLDKMWKQFSYPTNFDEICKFSIIIVSIKFIKILI